MADFDIAFPYSMYNEAGDPSSPNYGKPTVDNNGAAVRFGINQRYHPELDPTFYTTMPNDAAIKIAWNLYNNYEWQKIQGGLITSQNVATKIFDMSVNMGVTEASLLAQRSVAVNADGVIGPITVKALNEAPEDTTLKNLVYWWNWFIGVAISIHPEDANYEKNWRARANKLPQA